MTGVKVLAKAERRRFTAEYKLTVLREADHCQQAGENGALLRREGQFDVGKSAASALSAVKNFDGVRAQSSAMPIARASA